MDRIRVEYGGGEEQRTFEFYVKQIEQLTYNLPRNMTHLVDVPMDRVKKESLLKLMPHVTHVTVKDNAGHYRQLNIQLAISVTMIP